MGQAFDAAKNDDSFYLPPDVFQNPDFQRAMASFVSPDGKAARFIISHQGRSRDARGHSADRSDQDGGRRSAQDDSAGERQDFYRRRRVDLQRFPTTARNTICGSRSLVRFALFSSSCSPSREVSWPPWLSSGTVVLSLGASFGLSVLVWQYILGIKLHWMVLPMSVIVLLAVGSDYNLLLVARMKEEIAAGINTGIIRAMGGTGKVVTNAGLVFAFTMASMIFSDLRIIGQLGTTIGLGLLFDTLVVRSFMTPSIAALLGRWFWWPQTVRPRPASFMLRSEAPRPLVRSLLLREDRPDDAVTVELPRLSV